MKHFISSAIATISLAIALPAQAVVQVYKDSSGIAYISGLQNGQFVQIAYGNKINTIHVRPLGTCNIVKLPYKNFYPWNNVDVYLSNGQSPILSFTGSDLNAADIRGRATNLCNGTGRNTSLNWSDLGNGVYGLKNGATQGTANAVYLVGLPSSVVYDAKDGNPALRRMRVNACGFIKLSDTPAWPAASLGSFYYYLGPNPSDSFDSSTLSVKAPQLCHNGILYKPN